MNGVVKQALGIPSNVRWGSQSNAVFTYLETDFMKPVTSVGMCDVIYNIKRKTIISNSHDTFYS